MFNVSAKRGLGHLNYKLCCRKNYFILHILIIIDLNLIKYGIIIVNYDVQVGGITGNRLN